LHSSLHHRQRLRPSPTLKYEVSEHDNWTRAQQTLSETTSTWIIWSSKVVTHAASWKVCVLNLVQHSSFEPMSFTSDGMWPKFAAQLKSKMLLYFLRYILGDQWLQGQSTVWTRTRTRWSNGGSCDLTFTLSSLGCSSFSSNWSRL
jgi:hypothetical protein